MKRQIFSLCIVLLIFSLSVSSQVRKLSGDPHAAAKFAAEAAKNPQYVSLKSQLEELSRTATPQNTNAAAVKRLLTQNRALLKSLYTKAGVDAPEGGDAANKRRTSKIVSMNISKSVLNSKWKPVHPQLTKIVTPPFAGKYIVIDHNYFTPDTTMSNFGTGKIVVKHPGSSPSDFLGLYINMFKHQFTVPNNPGIVAAEITFEFSYQYTGWDTYGSIYGLQLLLRTSPLPDQTENNPMPVFEFKGGAHFPPFRIAGTIMPLDTITTEFGEFACSGTDSSTVHRYVVPGATFSTEFGLVFPYDTKKGWYNNYHYAEMKLKRITVRYLKAQD